VTALAMAPADAPAAKSTVLLGTSRESGKARDDEVEAEEMGMRSGKARCGAAGEGGIEDAEDERKGKEDASGSGSGRCWGTHSKPVEFSGKLEKSV
jgi:hypothetical protein